MSLTDSLYLPALPPHEPAPALAVARLLATEAARSTARLLRRGRRRRDSDAVATEYDDGYWRSVLERREWERAPDPATFLAGTSDERRVRKLDGRPMLVRDRDYYAWRAETLRRVMTAAAGSSTEVVELGAGYGYNLVTLALDPRWTYLAGYDISANGMDAARRLAAWLGIDHIRFGHVDLTDPASDGFLDVRGRCVLTYYCLEQLPSDIPRVLDALAASGPARVVHIESAAGMLGRGPIDLVNKLYVRSKDYQRSLVAELESRASEGRIRLVTRRRLRFGPTLHNEPALLVWEPVASY